MSKLNDLRARHAPSAIPPPSSNASWHEEQSYSAHVMAEYDAARVAAPRDIAYLLGELDAAHELLQLMWDQADAWHGEHASSHFRSEIHDRLRAYLAGEAADRNKLMEGR
jgi:hypothetical protein